MKPRRIIDEGVTPDGARLELALEHGHYIIRVDGVPLMSSAQHGSEAAMVRFAREALGPMDGPRVLIGGLGMGFTLRAALEGFDANVRIRVAELLPTVIRYNRGVLSHLADHPLEDPRLDLCECDVRDQLTPDAWDVILLDVDNGPDAVTTGTNDRLYSERGVARVWDALSPGGVVVIWSSYESDSFSRRLGRKGFRVRIERVRARWPLQKGPMHTLFVAVRPR